MGNPPTSLYHATVSRPQAVGREYVFFCFFFLLGEVVSCSETKTSKPLQKLGHNTQELCFLLNKHHNFLLAFIHFQQAVEKNNTFANKLRLTWRLFILTPSYCFRRNAAT